MLALTSANRFYKTHNLKLQVQILSPQSNMPLKTRRFQWHFAVGNLTGGVFRGSGWRKVVA
jgi:hypothetical protein